MGTAKNQSAEVKTAETGITDTAVRKFLKDAKLNDTLACDKQTGFHLRKVSKGGSWRYRYKDVLGKTKVKTIGSYPAMKPPVAAWWAQEWRHNGADPIAERKDARQAAITAEQQAHHRTMRNYLEGPYALVQARKKGGRDTLDRIRSKFSDWLDRDMQTLNAADIAAWQAEREKAGIAHTTVARDFGALRTMLRHAHKTGALERYPLENVELQAPTYSEAGKRHNIEHQSDRRMLTEAERTALLTGLEMFDQKLRAQRRSSRAHGKPHLASFDDVEFAHWFVPFCHLGLHTGLRPGDLHSLTWQELNVQFGRLVKYPEKTLHHPDPIKVDLPLNPEIKGVMTRWWQQCGKPDDGLVFPSPRTGKRLDRKAHMKPWGSVKELGGMSADLDFYCLRHNFISTLLLMGVSIFEVARLVGHKGTAMIEQHYGHLCPNAAATAMQAFGAAITKKTPGNGSKRAKRV